MSKSLPDIKCYYHNDLDGICSAAIVNQAFEGKSIEFIRSNYGHDLQLDPSFLGTYIVVDFSTPLLYDMRKQDLIWIDHHQTALKKFEDLSQVKGIRVNGTAACELAWKYFFPTQGMPYAVQFIGDMDVWKWELPESEAFVEGLKAKNLESYSPLWRGLFKPFFGGVNSTTSAIISSGEGILEWKKAFFKNYVDQFAYSRDCFGHSCLIANIQQTNSSLFDSIDNKSEYELLITYAWNGHNFSVTLYSGTGTVDVSQIAELYGGGGHKGAAGFSCNQLPWD